jgi:hypothetical protein
MSDFSQNIQNFKQTGDYTYEFDSVGNMYFNSSSTDFSQVFLKLPLTNVVYNNPKIEKFYDPNFVEFVPNTGSAEITSSIEALQQQLSIISQSNAALQSQLDTVVAQGEATSTATGPNQLAIQQVILELRKALGQGRVDSAFSTDFPYTPINKLPSAV